MNPLETQLLCPALPFDACARAARTAHGSHHTTWLLGALGACLIACGGEAMSAETATGAASFGGADEPTGTETQGDTTGGQTPPEHDSTGMSGHTSAPDSGNLPLPRFDIPIPGGEQTGDGCRAVDFLFVIDNSVSMRDQQTALKAAFPGFIATIQETLPTTDYHIMVVDTDAAGRCSPGSCSHSTCQEADQYACEDLFDSCDVTRGAGVVHPAGEAASNAPCATVAGKRYITTKDTDLVETFSCMASVGLAGNASERPMDGMVEAVSASLVDPGGCNDGFLREDAIMVVTFLSDDGSVEDENTAQQTYDALVAAKGGNATSVVMLGLTPGAADCNDGAGEHWIEMVDKFGDHGFQGSICAEEYDTFFADAVGIIEDTCLDFQG